LAVTAGVSRGMVRSATQKYEYRGEM
jgi:hypothetical protein